MANAKTIEIILKAIGDFGDVKGNIDVIQKSLNQLKLNPQLKQNFSNIFADLQKQTAKYQDYLNSGFKTKGDVTGLEKTGNKINALLNQLQTNMNKIDPSVLKESFKIDTTQFEELNNKLKETQNTINQITSSDKFKGLAGQVDGVVSKLNTLSKSKAITQFQESFKTGKIEETKIALDKLIENANKFNDEGKKTEYLKYINQLKTAFDDLSKIDGLQKANDDLKGFSSQLESLGTKQLEELLNAFAQGKINVQNFVNAVRGYSGATAEAAKKTFDFGSELDHFKNRAAYFLGLTNSINLFKRALQKALETVKELDAVMTETAVVTDFTVGDMWEKLPEYAAHAKELGSSIKDVYAATTLYYQQGLKTNEAMGVGVETMKMARIANLEAGDATQYMTAALRGFNMEVNELNAERVNDVYSELAAITAADTSQIATAMSKTASIASAANMEFETTAALLAQIIETTQEAPETAGTALKTIIARFSEVKKLREEGANTGEDEEGEAIDVNKIQGALRTVGISMDDFFAGAEGLDSILLKLAEKWKDLDFETQRYIATTAAGSRQQSRFIAMMSDYERTMELATAANNSAGASQQQFDKTLDSMEAKLAKLTTAWQEFTMGLANNEILKGAVDALTFILNAINKLIDALSGNNGIAKSVITLNLAITAIGGVRAALHKLFNSELANTVTTAFKQISDESKKTSVTAGQNIKEGIKSGLDQAVQDSVVAGQQIAQNLSGPSKNLQFSQKELFIGPPLPPAPGEQAPPPDPSNAPPKQGQPQGEGKLSKSLKNADAQSWRLAGTLTSLTGIALNWGASAAKAGNETSVFGAGLQAAGSASSVLGASMRLLAPVLVKVFGSVTAAVPWLAAAVAVVGLLAAGFQAMKNASPEGQLEAAKEAAEEAAEAANEAAEAYNNLKSNFESLEGKESSLEKLTVGTQEWKDAVQELNNQILDLIELYPELAESVSFDGPGILTISEKDKNLALDKYLQRQRNTQTAKIGANINELRAQQNLDYSELDSNLKIVIEEKIESPNYKNNNTISSEFIKRQEEILDSQTPHYGSESAFIGQDTEKKYDKAETEALARAIASGDWKGREGQIATITGTSEPKEFVNTEEYKELRNFGQALIESDTAIKIFTDSLENAAILNADVSEEYKDKISGIYDTEAIENMLAKEKENIDLSENREYWEKEYAKAMNYQYENGKFYTGEGENKKEVAVLDQDIKSQLAAIRVQNKLTENIELMAGKMGELAKNGGKLGEAFVNIASKADGAGLTLEDIKNLEGKFDGSYSDAAKRDEQTGEFIEFSDESLQTLYSQVEHLYSSPEEFYRIFSEAYSQAEERKASSEEKLTHMGMEGAFQNAKIDTGALAGITDNLYDAFLASGPDVAQALAGSIEETLNAIEDPEQAQIFADALNAIDWQNLDDVEELDAVLAGMDFDYAIDGLDELKQEIITAAKATKTFNLDAIKEQVKSIEELVEDIEDREDTERKFTQEEYDTITKASPKLASQFVATGLDEFVYVGDSMQSLIEALNQNTAALLGDYGEQVRGNAAMSEKWLANEDTGNWGGGKIEDGTTNLEVFSKIIHGALGEGDVNIDDLRRNMELFGMGQDSGRDLLDYGFEDLKNVLAQDYANYYGSGGIVAQQNIDDAAAYTQTEETIRLSKMEGTEILNDNQATEENKQAVLDAKVALEGLQEEYDKTTKSLKAQDSALASNEKLIKASIVDAKNYEDKLADLAKTYDDNKDALKDTNKGTREYQKALTNITKAAKEAFGDNITEDFVENNLDLFEDWYKGTEGSADRLRSALVDSLIEASNGTESEVNRIRNIVSGLDGLNFDIYGHADATQLFNELAAVMGSAEEAARAMEVLGYSVTWEETGVKRMLILDPESPTGKRMVDIPEYKAVVTDGLGNRAGANRSSYGGNKGGGGGGGGGSKTKWENPYDEFYNVVEDINEALRQREKLERRYQALLDKTGTKASDLVKNARDQINSLEKQKKLREGLLEGRTRQMSDIESEYSDLSKYAWYNEQDGTIEIDWEKINALDGSTNEKLTSRIEEYIKKLEEQQDLIEQEEDELEAIEETLREIRDQGKDEYFDFEEQIKDALIDQRQKEIDKLSAINDSINDTNSRLIDAMQSSIDKYRQDRENERTEEELSDKQRRLAYLQQDTSGANALEIMQLQEEIDQGVEDYTDQLIDQKINELQEQNDEAAEQREKQIAIAEAQLKKWEESGEIWNNVYELMGKGMDEDGIIPGSELQNLLKEAANFEGMSELQKMDWLENLENNVAQAIQWLMVGNSTEALISKGELSKGQQITFTTSDGDEVTGILQDNGDVIDSQGNVYTDVYRDQEGNWVTEEETKGGGTSTGGTGDEEDTSNQQQTNYPYGKASEVSGEVKYGDRGKKVKAVQWALKKLGYSIGSSGVDGIFGNDTLKAVKKFQRKSKISADGVVGKNTKKAFKLKQYASGGLADFTGPAWLDGTKSKPEYILNAEQTKSFFKLVDILSGLKSGTNQSSQITGDSIYDVDINVESIGSDYDVEKLATTIKRMINDDARYRNNNAINLQR